MCFGGGPHAPDVAPIPTTPPQTDINPQSAPQLNLKNQPNQMGSLPSFRNDLTIPVSGQGVTKTDLNIP